MKLIKREDGTFQVEQITPTELEAMQFLTRFFLNASDFTGHFVNKIQRIRDTLQEAH